MPRIRGLTFSALRQMLAAWARSEGAGEQHVLLCIADHYEPMWSNVSLSQQRDRVHRWVLQYPKITAGLSDAFGRGPQHTFFYPAEEYNAELIEPVAAMCRAGHGEIEIHLHHDKDSPAHLAETLTSFAERLHYEHGQLAKDPAGRISYGFVHGNWALCNALPDGRWCGVNDELTILRETGCYADFTMPAAPSEAQTSTVNSIYYATSAPERPKGHDRGIAAQVGREPPPNSLLMIQGPTMIDWTKRRWRFPPGLENGDLHGGFAPDARRLALWRKAAIGVVGQPNWVFIKLHTHGAPERNASMLLGEPMRRFHEHLASLRRRHAGFHYYYVTAREMAELVHQAERGATKPDLAVTASR